MHSTEILELVRRLGGAARVAELPATRFQLRRLVEQGHLTRVGRGACALVGASREAVIAAEHDAVLSCRTALAIRGVDVPGDSSIVHFSVPRHRGTRRTPPPRTRRHFEDVGTDRPRTASLRDAAARAATCGPYDDAVATLDRVVHGRDESFLEDVLAAVRRTSPSRAAALSRDVSRSSRSVIETRCRLALRRSGLAVRDGVYVPGIGEVDLLVGGLVIVELDGFAYHSSRKQFCTDRRRDRKGLSLGLPTLRFTYEDCDPAGVVAEAGSLLEAMAGTPFPFTARVPASVRDAVSDLRRFGSSDAALVTGWQHLIGRDLDTARSEVDRVRGALEAATRSTVTPDPTTVT